MQAQVYSLEGKVLKKINLPSSFDEIVREDLIRRAVLSDESKLRQPKGSYPLAGKETSARYRGRKEDFGSLKNRGQAKLPREVGAKGRAGKVKRIPSAVKGRRAHPPKVEKKIVENMNKKEYKKALCSALAATKLIDLVKKRGHVFNIDSLPVIVENKFEELTKTSQVVSVLKNLGLFVDVERSKEKSKPLSGIRKTRTRSKYVPKSLLIVVRNGNILKAARNLSGVDVVTVEDLKVRNLAPGTHPGRLTLFTENAIEDIRIKYG